MSEPSFSTARSVDVVRRDTGDVVVGDLIAAPAGLGIVPLPGARLGSPLSGGAPVEQNTHLTSPPIVVMPWGRPALGSAHEAAAVYSRQSRPRRYVRLDIPR